MATYVRNYEMANKTAAELGLYNMRPGRCADCSRGMYRPVGGPSWRELSCPYCGGSMIQTTGGAKTIKGYLVITQAEAKAIAAGEPVERKDAPSWYDDSHTGVRHWSRCGHRAEYDINYRCYTCHKLV